MGDDTIPSKRLLGDPTPKTEEDTKSILLIILVIVLCLLIALGILAAVICVVKSYRKRQQQQAYQQLANGKTSKTGKSWMFGKRQKQKKPVQEMNQAEVREELRRNMKLNRKKLIENNVLKDDNSNETAMSKSNEDVDGEYRIKGLTITPQTTVTQSEMDDGFGSHTGDIASDPEEGSVKKSNTAARPSQSRANLLTAESVDESAKGRTERTARPIASAHRSRLGMKPRSNSASKEKEPAASDGSSAHRKPPRNKFKNSASGQPMGKASSSSRSSKNKSSPRDESSRRKAKKWTH